jgi:hypothetical protein
MMFGENGLSNKEERSATRREFLLYWAGFLIVVIGAVSILMTISGVLIDVLSSRCWYPIISPMMGVEQPPSPTQGVMIPNYCYNPMVAVIRFIFNLLAEFVLIGAGVYMLSNGKKN